MILLCPSCQAQYVIPDGSIGDEGRTVKCTQCSHKWHQAGSDDEVIHVDAEVFETEDVKEIEEIQSNNAFDDDEIPEKFYEPAADIPDLVKERMPIKPIIFSFILFMALIFSILLTGRQYFVEQWEPAAKLFDIVGLPVSVAGEGLAFDSVSADIEEVNGERVLTIKGRIDNDTNGNIALPTLKISSYVDNDWLKDWVIPLGGKIMQAQQSIAFDYRLSDIPDDNNKVVVTFAYH